MPYSTFDKKPRKKFKVSLLSGRVSIILIKSEEKRFLKVISFRVVQLSGRINQAG